jgi:hypothetical protein
MKLNIKQWWNDTGRRETYSEKNLSQYTSTTNPHMDRRKLAPGSPPLEAAN